VCQGNGERLYFTSNTDADDTPVITLWRHPAQKRATVTEANATAPKKAKAADVDQAKPGVKRGAPKEDAEEGGEGRDKRQKQEPQLRQPTVSPEAPTEEAKHYHVFESDSAPSWVLMRWVFEKEKTRMRIWLTDGDLTWGGKSGFLRPCIKVGDPAGYVRNFVEVVRSLSYSIPSAQSCHDSRQTADQARCILNTRTMPVRRSL
jgi:hypothetical protein